ncbi:MAG: hypothetical protein HC939_24830 [Pleurocapsa sp. SU_5_0]|nr:hypothetical protein [Pleurocapsa sp. SU_5_0]NJO96950.1 hypothetical protein [Pleurocapsa sp. CRU_1_2]NJR47709.1 hypothetical protein [Hyellaceae cyanobacterium CSU_1_1]
MNEPDKFFIEDFSLQCKIKLTEANIIYKTYGELARDRNIRYFLISFTDLL